MLPTRVSWFEQAEARTSSRRRDRHVDVHDEHRGCGARLAGLGPRDAAELRFHIQEGRDAAWVYFEKIDPDFIAMAPLCK